ncbi:hypothetical protein [Paenibacillus sp. NPDC057967]|uniref:hypothetical protein n=1 Tax=Paenibacillus sp. NPDC057967 TaxID=3346293 RepID=UPI0036DD4AEE
MLTIIICVYLALGLVFQPYSITSFPWYVRVVAHVLWLPGIITFFIIVWTSDESLF